LAALGQIALAERSGAARRTILYPGASRATFKLPPVHELANAPWPAHTGFSMGTGP
jgi:hypothetical protein